MHILAEKVEWVLTTILESMETDQERVETSPFQADECEDGKDLELNTLIEPCW
jgi:hypothetical protein